MHEVRSRALNALIFGDPETMICATIHERRIWPAIIIVNVWAVLAWREPWGHTARIAYRERLRRVDALDERLRLSEGL